jgi:cyclopropane-fatty-acyl-phospholipid synthase
VFLLHSIGDSYTKATADPWFEKYIFPNSFIPSMTQISASAERLVIIEDWRNFSAYYDLTLMSWFENFNKSWHILKHKHDDRVCRMWKYYLLC